VAVGASQVEVELVDGGLGQEVGAAGEALQVEELVLDEAVDGFDVALVGVSGGRDADVLAVSQRGGEARGLAVAVVGAGELGAVVGLPGQVAEVDAVGGEVALHTRGEELAGAGGAASGEGEEEQPAAHLAGGVLDERQAQALGLRPVVRDIFEVFGVGRELLEEAPLGFEVGQVLFALVLAAAAVDQPVGAPDALQGAVAEGEVELADQSAGAESGQATAQGHHGLLDLGRGLARLAVGRSRAPQQALGAFLLIAPHPLAHGAAGGLEGARGGFQTVLASVLHQPQAVVIGVFHLADKAPVRDGLHEARL
jgi:hypothetical protein